MKNKSEVPGRTQAGATSHLTPDSKPKAGARLNTAAGSVVLETVQPWWKFGLVWLVIAGPAIVVVAGIVTVWMAVRTPDPVVDVDYYRKGIEINRTLAPALVGRNHAATPSEDILKPRN